MDDAADGGLMRGAVSRGGQRFSADGARVANLLVEGTHVFGQLEAVGKAALALETFVLCDDGAAGRAVVSSMHRRGCDDRAAKIAKLV